MAVSPLASLLAQTQPGGIANTAAPLTAATTGYAAPQAPPTVQAVTAAPKAPTVQVPSLALAAAAKATPGPNLTKEYAKIGAKAKAAQQASASGGPTGNVGAQPSSGTGSGPAGPSPHGIVAAAHSMLGVPYVWGGTNTKTGLDCSAFVQAAYARVGIQIPRTTYTQFAAGKPVSLKNIQPGDAVYVEPEANGQPGHVGLYIGNGQIQESPHKGTSNQIVPLAAFLGDTLVGIRRF